MHVVMLYQLLQTVLLIELPWSEYQQYMPCVDTRMKSDSSVSNHTQTINWSFDDDTELCLL